MSKCDHFHEPHQHFIKLYLYQCYQFILQLVSSLFLKIKKSTSMRYVYFLLLVFLLIPVQMVAQESDPTLAIDTSHTKTTVKKGAIRSDRRLGDIGAGLGLDYGGLVGARASFYPMKYMAIFASLGYNILGVGWNAGVIGRFIPADGKHGVRPYIKVMYGVNGSTVVEGKSMYDKMYYGITVGAGLEARFGKTKRSGINADINVPFRSPDFWATIREIKDNPNINMRNDPFPVTVSIGYVIEF
jgi:hypothetical protein